jgi:hypothetical protein
MLSIRRIFGCYKFGKVVIGYGLFLPDEGCYEYNENECFIFSSIYSAENLILKLYGKGKPYRIVPIYIKTILRDFGFSNMNYAIEPRAMAVFKRIAEKNGIYYESNLWDPSDDLIVLHVYKNKFRQL